MDRREQYYSHLVARLLERSIFQRTVFSHLVFVEFQYTTCLLATAAEIKLKKKIVAFQAGRAPGVPILAAAGAAERLCTGGEWRANQVRRPGREGSSVKNFPKQASTTHEQTSTSCAAAVSPDALSLRREGYTMQVNVNDYLDIYCPHYNDSQRMVGTGEQYILYMVSYRGYRNCDPQLGFKRWECNRPHAPHAPIKFSEKFQRYSAFSLGYEFHVGQEYYYISTPTHHHGRSCLRLRVYVCCSTASDVDDEPEPTEPDYTLRPGLKIDDIDEFNPFVPKLEKSVSGSSPTRDRLLLTVTMLLLAALFIS
ncbi:ephrin-A3-like isoform X2 [Sander vitreus]